MISVLSEPKNALTKQFAMAMEGVELEFTRTGGAGVEEGHGVRGCAGADLLR